MGKLVEKTSKGSEGTLRKKLLIIPAERKLTRVLPAVNSVSLDFCRPGRITTVRTWTFDTAKQAKDHYDILDVD